ncbi:MAG: ABC transporter permease [Nitrososphaerota archaeon]
MLPVGRRWAALPLITPAIALQSLFFFLPLFMILLVSFTSRDSFFFSPLYTFDNYVKMFRIYRIDFQNTFFLAGMAGLIDIIIGYPFAYILLRKVTRFADVFRAILIIPLFGELYIAYGLLYLILPGGPVSRLLDALGISPLDVLYSAPMAIFGMSLYTLPFVVYNIGISLQGIDRSYEEAARCLGASRLKTFLRVTLPLSLPGIITGWLTSFGWNLGTFAIPVLLGGPILGTRVLANQIWTTSLVTSDFGMGAAIGVMVVAITMVVFYIVVKLSRGVLV